MVLNQLWVDVWFSQGKGYIVEDSKKYGILRRDKESELKANKYTPETINRNIRTEIQFK